MKKKSIIILTVFLLIAVLGLAFRVLFSSHQNTSPAANVAAPKPGILALNLDKSSYTPGTPVLFQMASLGSAGQTLCHSHLQLEITGPGMNQPVVLTGSQIVTTSTCDPSNNVTSEPDYIARYTPSQTGNYKVKLLNKDSNQSISFGFTVSTGQPDLLIERTGATRINPFKSDRYSMGIKVTAQKDFTGTITESVPANFKIIWQGPAKITPAGDTQTLTWFLSLKAGETKQLAYDYQAPKISPALFSFGPLSLGKLVIGNSGWSLASDAYIVSTGTGGNWNATGSWAGGVIPGILDDVHIAPGATVTVTASTDSATLIFDATGTSTGTLSVSASQTLAVHNPNGITASSSATLSTAAAISGSGSVTTTAITIGSTVTPSTNATTTFTLSISSSTFQGAVTVNSYYKSGKGYNNGILAITGGTHTVNGTITTATAASSTSTISLANATLNLSAATPWNLSATGTNTTTLNGTSAVVNYNSSSAQTIYATTYYTLKVNNTNISGATLGAATTVTNFAVGDVNSASYFFDGGYQLTGNASGTLTAATGSTITLGNSTTVTTFPTNFTNANITLNTSTVVYRADGTTTVSGTPTYGNLTLAPALSAARAYTFDGAATINGNFDIAPTTGAYLLTVNLGGTTTVASGKTTTIEGTTATSKLATTASSYNFSSGLINIAANGTLDNTGSTATITLTGTSGPLLTRAGTFTAGSSKVDFSETAADLTLTSGTFSTTNAFYNLQIDMTGHTGTLGAAVTVNNNLTLNSGTLADGGYQITGNATGTLSAASGATLTLGNLTTVTTFPTSFTNAHISLASGSTVIYQADGTTTISNIPTYGNLTLSPAISTAGRTYTFSGAASATGNFNVQPSGTQALTVNLAGTLTVTGTTTLQSSGSATANLDTVSGSNYAFSTGLLSLQGGGTLTAENSDISLTGTTGTLFTLGSGNFTAGGSTVIINGDGSPTLTSGAITFNNLNLTPTNSTADTYTFGTGNLIINGNFTIQSSGSKSLTVNMAGDITVAQGKSTIITWSGTATSKLVPGSSNPSLTTGSLSIVTPNTFDGTGSSSNITLTNNSAPFSLSGTFIPGLTTFIYAPAGTSGVTVLGTTYHNVTFNKTGNIFSLNGTLTTDAGGNLNIQAGTLDVVNGVNMAINVGGNWTNNDTFLPQQGTVTFNTSAAAVISGPTTFYNFTSNVGGKQINFTAGQTFRFNGNITLTGTAASFGFGTSNSTVATSTSASATSTSTQRKSFYNTANSVYWAFYYTGSAINYAYSPDGSHWSTPVSFANTTNDFSLHYKNISGTGYVFIAYFCNSYNICLKRGQLSSSSISWSSEYTVFTGSSSTDNFLKPVVSLDSNNYVCVAANKYLGGSTGIFSNVITDRSTNVATGDLSAWNTSTILGIQQSVGEDLAFVPQAGSDMVLISGNNSNHISAWKYDGAAWSDIGSNYNFFTFPTLPLDNPAKALAVDGSGNIYIGGSFVHAENQLVNYIVRFNPTTAAYEPLGDGTTKGVSGAVNALAVSGSYVYVGGSFITAYHSGTNLSDNYITRYNTGTGAFEDVGDGITKGVNSQVNALAVSGSYVYVGGSFTTAYHSGGYDLSDNYITKYNTGTGAFEDVGDGTSKGVGNQVNTLAASGSYVYVGGYFNTAGDYTSNQFAIYSPVVTPNVISSAKISAASDSSGNVHLLYTKTNNNLYYNEMNSSGTWGTEVLLHTGTVASDSISVNTTTGDLYATYIDNNVIYSRKGVSPYASANWDTEAKLLNAGTNTNLTSGFATNTNTYFSLYTSGSSSPYNVNFLLISGTNLLSVNSTDPATPTQWIVNEQGTNTINYTKITNAGCDGSSQTITLNYTDIDGGNNGTCWNFPSPPHTNINGVNLKGVNIW